MKIFRAFEKSSVIGQGLYICAVGIKVPEFDFILYDTEVKYCILSNKAMAYSVFQTF